ncbi:hypothetical protein B0H13DRAFT_1624443, partial [Mycena leptocephala]
MHRYTRGPDGTRGFHARKKLIERKSCGTSRLVSCRSAPVNVHSRNAPIFLLAILLLCASLIQIVDAATPRSAFSMFSLNANGLVHTNKMAHISSAINHRRPHAFILNESKTNSKTAKNLPNNDYEIHEESGVKTTNHHLYKWGVVLGIRKDIQVVQRLTNLDAALKGRVIAVDIALQTTNGKAYHHRVFAVYAPWDPGTTDTRNFWPALTDLVRSTTTPWYLGGDLNATVSAAERATGGADARDKYLAFLAAVDGHDLWTDYPERSRFYDWTSSGQDVDKNGGSIIDRFVTSKHTLLDAEIFATNGGKDFPRIRYPAKLEAHKHEAFRVLFDERATAENLHTILVNDDASFLRLYSGISNILIATAEEAYGRVTRYKKRSEAVTNEKIQKLLATVRAFGGAIRIIRGDTDFIPSRESTKTAQRARNLYASSEPGEVSLLAFTNKLKRTAYRELFVERALEVKRRATFRDKMQITSALRGGSTKRLVKAAEFIPMPLVLNTPDSDDLIGDPEIVKEKTREYWSNLYDHDPPPNIPKPWLDTKSVREARARTATDPFIWPRPPQLFDLRALLRRGNARPAPGPDGWEKWVVKNLSDNSLALVLQLVSYIVMNSTFPGDIKDTTLAMFHKRGLRTDLSNWRGIFLYLASIKCWAARHKETVFAIKRDQMKGFDYLAPEGMYDAVRAYGLPQQIIDIDKQSQTDV